VTVNLWTMFAVSVTSPVQNNRTTCNVRICVVSTDADFSKYDLYSKPHNTVHYTTKQHDTDSSVTDTSTLQLSFKLVCLHCAAMRHSILSGNIHELGEQKLLHVVRLRVLYFSINELNQSITLIHLRAD